MKVLHACFGVISLVLPVAAQAGSWGAVQALSPGTSVQLRLMDGESVRGEVESVSDGAIALNLKHGQRMLDRQEIAQLSLQKQGRRKRNALVGLAIGTGGGLAFGAGVDAASGPCKYACTLGSDAGKLIFTPVGAIVGVMTGAALPTGGWEIVYEIR